MDFELRSGGLEAGPPEVLALVPGSAALVADPTVPVTGDLLDAAGDGLEVVANFAVGYDNIDLTACAERGVVVTNTPDVLTDATAELALGLTVAAARQIPATGDSLRAGEWTGWDPAGYRGIELSGATFGVIGMGRIGRRYAELVRGFGGRLLYVSREAKPEAETETGAIRVELEQLLRDSDVVSLHVAAGETNRHLIDQEALSLMKKSAILVNTARGTLVDSAALAQALEAGSIAAAGLDVFEGEPRVPECLLNAPRLVMTPHIGSATYRARDLMAELVARNVIAVLSGEEPLTQVTG